MLFIPSIGFPSFTQEVELEVFRGTDYPKESPPSNQVFRLGEFLNDPSVAIPVLAPFEYLRDSLTGVIESGIPARRGHVHSERLSPGTVLYAPEGNGPVENHTFYPFLTPPPRPDHVHSFVPCSPRVFETRTAPWPIVDLRAKAKPRPAPRHQGALATALRTAFRAGTAALERAFARVYQ